MPIYAYKCESCGHSKDVLQKMSDAPLTDCPLCGTASFKKQLTAAGFQLKGTGWYATDFKGGPTSVSPTEPKTESKTESKSDSKSDAAPAAAPSSSTAPAPSPAPATSSTSAASPSAT
jgi:putative FmdB family regulatory protein